MNTIEKAIYEGLCTGLGVQERLTVELPDTIEKIVSDPDGPGRNAKQLAAKRPPSGRAGDVILIHRDGDRFYADLPGEAGFHHVVRSRRRDLVGKIRAMGFRVADACLTGG